MTYSTNEVPFLYSLPDRDLNRASLKMHESSIYVISIFNYYIIACD